MSVFCSNLGCIAFTKVGVVSFESYLSKYAYIEPKYTGKKFKGLIREKECDNHKIREVITLPPYLQNPSFLHYEWQFYYDVDIF